MPQAGILSPTFLWSAWVRGYELPPLRALEVLRRGDLEWAAETSPPCPLGPGSAPHGVVVSSIAGSTELLVTWQQGSEEPQEHVVDWAQDGDPPEDLNWVRLPPGKLSALLPGEALVYLGSHPRCWESRPMSGFSGECVLLKISLIH